MFKFSRLWMGPDEKKFNEGFGDLFNVDQNYQIPEPSVEAKNRLAQMQEMNVGESYDNAFDSVFGKESGGNEMKNFGGGFGSKDDFSFGFNQQDEQQDFGRTPLQVVSDSVSPANIVLIEPRSFEDSLEIVNHLKGRKSVIVNLQYLDKDLAQRVIDFVSGATLALDGTQERVGSGVFIFASINCKLETESEGVKAYKDLFAKSFGA